MRVLNNDDYKLFERLVSLSQKELKQAMANFLKKKYKNYIFTKNYLVAIGDIPIALVAHLDTVFRTPVSNLYYDQKKGVLWSPEGLGADDRAGVFAIIKILQSGYRPSVIFTTDEEAGGIGANTLANDYVDCPIPNLKYMIELDRRGTNDCVFYDCYCPEFVKYVESFGFCEKWGSFSDISFLMPMWMICGVNLSVGYEDEHSYVETLNINTLFDIIRKVKNMLDETDIPDFEYDELKYNASFWWRSSTDASHCNKCKKFYTDYELIPVKGLNREKKHYCPDCVVGNITWCDLCQEAFEMSDTDRNRRICKECAESIYV